MLFHTISALCLMFVIIKGFNMDKGYSVYEPAYDNKYQTRDAVAFLFDTGRCPQNYFYYRQLDLCYTFKPLVNAHGPSIIASCKKLGDELIRIDSEERQQYIRNITVNIEKVYPAGICIQGTNLIHPMKKWTFVDRTIMTYFNWHNGEPSRRGYIRIDRSQDYGWGVPLIPTSWTCSYICEKR